MLRRYLYRAFESPISSQHLEQHCLCLWQTLSSSQFKKLDYTFNMLVELAALLAVVGVSSVRAQSLVYECDRYTRPNYDACR